MEITGTFESDSIKKLLIRPELAPTEGMTSLANCLQLAHCWPNASQVRFVLSSQSSTLAEKRISESGFDCIRLNDCSGFANEFSQLKTVVAKWPPTAMILDGSQFALLHSALLSGLPCRVVCLKNPEIVSRPDLHLPSGLKDKSEDKKIVSNVRRIAVIVHGSDNCGLSTKILRALDQIKSQSLSVDVCAAPENTHIAALRILASSNRHSVRIHKSLSNIGDLMAKFDLGIANIGSGCFDLAYHAVPLVAIDSIDATRQPRQLFIRREIPVANSDIGATEIHDTIRSLIRDRDRRRQMSQAVSRIVDGNGASRIIELLSNAITPLKKAS